MDTRPPWWRDLDVLLTAMEPKEEARQAITQARPSLLALSRSIHAQPELGFQERKACAQITNLLESRGLPVERKVGGLETAFAARIGNGPLRVVICAEYDALPGVGHACGHNLIAAMAVGAGLGLAKVVDDLGLTVTILGTPAEENGGGKVLLLRAGALANAHAAMMVHPGPVDVLTPPIIALSWFDVAYTGKEAHASAFPELGVNAADALTVAQTSIGLLRQHLRPTDRVHGITIKGGDAPNIIPAHTEATYMVRAQTIGDLQGLQKKVERCFEAGAVATGATVEIRPRQDAYANMLHDTDMAEAYRRNAESLGRIFPDDGRAKAAASTDMGNVSQVIPSIHPIIGIDSYPVVNHQPEFAAACVTPRADQALIDGSVAMAWTVIDLAIDERLRQRLIKSAARKVAAVSYRGLDHAGSPRLRRCVA